MLKPRTPGELPPEDFDGYVFVRTEKDKDGNLKHIYKPKTQVNTIWVTVDGKVLKPRTPGEFPPEDFDGYVFVRTEKDKDGNLKHIYKPYDKVTTIWVTTDGKVLKPRTPGELPPEDFDGYVFVRTEKDKDGNLKHIYKPKTQVNTIWVTVDGKVLKPRTPGEFPPEDFDGYVFVRTV